MNWISTGALVALFPWFSAAVTNDWTRSTSGYWEESYWSAGSLPDIAQDLVAIRNSQWKAVAIGGNTTANFPNALTVRNLLIEAPPDSFNQLLLNWAGFSVPLTVQNTLTVGTNAALASYHSALSAGKMDVYGPITVSDTSANLNQVTLYPGGSLSLTDSWFWCSNGLATPLSTQLRYNPEKVGVTNHNAIMLIDSGDLTFNGLVMEQLGGLLQATNGTAWFVNSTCSLANATWELGRVWLNNSGVINQYGGVTHAGSLNAQYLWDLGFGDRPFYSLSGGELRIDGELLLVLATFLQNSGTTHAGSLTLTTGCPHKGGCGQSHYTLTEGLLSDGDATIGQSYFFQTGGTHVTTNQLKVVGWDVEYGVSGYGTYLLSNGVFTAGVLSLGYNSIFEQAGGTAAIAELIELNDARHVSGPGFCSFALGGGVLSCKSLKSIENGAGMLQTGGYLKVFDTLYFSGRPHWNWSGWYSYPVVYSFKAGSLNASNIEMYANWQIFGSSETFRIFNPGYLKLGGTLELNSMEFQAREHLGRFILASNATIDLPGSSSVLEFDFSAQESWAIGATLIITNWTGSPGGGGSERVLFGTSRAGLNQAQLNCIRFRMGATDYPAHILDSGEIVPALPKLILCSQQVDAIVVDWTPTNGWILQTATNLSGPYVDIPGALCPYTNRTLQSQQFFRLSMN